MSLKTYRQYLPKDSKWMAEYANKMGHRPFMQYLNRVYVRLDKLQIGCSIDIDKLVKEENRELFVKCTCDFITQASRLTRDDGYPTHCFQFSDDFKNIKRQ